jgi:hypothetical protein
MNFTRYCVILLAVATAPSFGLAPRLAAEDLDADVLYNKVVKSCVYIITEMKEKNAYAQGSGSLIDAEQKLILTNYHVVDEEPYVFIQFPMYVKGELITEKDKYKDRWKQGFLTRSKVLFRDKSRDLAIVKADKIPTGTKAIPLAKSSPRIGATVWQIGNAGAVSQVFRTSKGDVSAVGAEKFLVGDASGEHVFEVNAKMVTSTAPTNPGDSGGPLFDKRGYQVAVTESGSNGASLVNHFVDVTEVRALLKEKKITIKELSEEPDPALPKKDAEPKKDGVTAPKKDDASATNPAEERAAADKLRSAKLFRDGDDNRDTYISRLKEIVAKWPNTAAGKEAKKLLEGVK